jgi:hypothetical protein
VRVVDQAQHRRLFGHFGDHAECGYSDQEAIRAVTLLDAGRDPHRPCLVSRKAALES